MRKSYNISKRINQNCEVKKLEKEVVWMLDWTRAHAIAVHVLRVKGVSKNCPLLELEKTMQDTKTIQKVSKSMFGKELTEKELTELRAMLPDISNRLKGITP